MTDEDLIAIEARLRATTPWPWMFAWGDEANPDDRGDWREIISAPLEKRQEPHDSSNAAHVIGPLDWENGGIIHEADAVFIRHAPEDMAALIAEVKRVSAELAQWREIGARAWVGAIKHGSACGCWMCQGARALISEEHARRLLYPGDYDSEAEHD